MTTIRARFTTPTITATPAALETLATAGIAPAAVLAATSRASGAASRTTPHATRNI